MKPNAKHKSEALRDFLNRHMTRLGLSQVDLANRIGMPTSTINNWFKSDVAIPNRASLEKLGQVFEIHPDLIRSSLRLAARDFAEMDEAARRPLMSPSWRKLFERLRQMAEQGGDPPTSLEKMVEKIAPPLGSRPSA